MKLRFFKCEHCGNIIIFAQNKGVPVMCCGEKMTEIQPNTTDAATEKHLPVFSINGNKVDVLIGEVEHPMTQEHHISFICLETNQGYQMKELDPTGSPKATFSINDNEQVVAVYEYCNLHGLWKEVN